MDQRTFDMRVRQLADTLRKQGLAASDARAREMAQDILQTEQRQLEQYDKNAYNPAMNPQQRTGPAVARPQPVEVAQPVHEPLQTEQAPARPQEEPRPDPDPNLRPQQPTIPEPQAPAPEPLTVPDAPKSEPTPVPAAEPQAPPQAEAPTPAAPTTPPAAPVQESPAPAAQPEQQPERQQEEQPKQQQPKVDLTEMFNFSKRK